MVGLYLMIMGSHDFEIEGQEDEVSLSWGQARWAVNGVITGQSGAGASRKPTDEADGLDSEQ